MFRSIFFLLHFLICFSILLPYCADKSTERTGILVYLPQKKELANWTPLGKPQIAEGEDLTLLINGGAELYFEYGFLRAVFQSYIIDGDQNINVEIYEMEDAASAYGVYTFKTGSKGQSIYLGTEGLMENYYLNFWKGNYIVTIIGFDTDKETQNNLIKLGKIIEPKIDETGNKPVLSNFIVQDNSKLIYLQGPMALFNQYEFSKENIFGIREGILADNGHARVFLFQYHDDSESLSWYRYAKNHMRTNPQFRDMRSLKDGFTCHDSKNTPISVFRFQKYILIDLGDDTSGSKGVLREVMHRIKNYQTNQQ